MHQDFIIGAPGIKSRRLKFGGLKYYPLCGFDGGQFLNKRHVRKLEFGEGLQFGFGKKAASFTSITWDCF